MKYPPYRVLVMVPEVWLSGGGHWTEPITSSAQVSTPLKSCNMYKLHLGWSIYAPKKVSKTNTSWGLNVQFLLLYGWQICHLVTHQHPNRWLLNLTSLHHKKRFRQELKMPPMQHFPNTNPECYHYANLLGVSVSHLQNSVIITLLQKMEYKSVVVS
jgi:hypothetical protein